MRSSWLRGRQELSKLQTASACPQWPYVHIAVDATVLVKDYDPANVDPHDRVATIYIHLPVLGVLLANQCLHLAGSPFMVPSPHIDGNLLPSSNALLKDFRLGFPVAERPIHLMYIGDH